MRPSNRLLRVLRVCGLPVLVLDLLTSDFALGWTGKMLTALLGLVLGLPFFLAVDAGTDPLSGESTHEQERR